MGNIRHANESQMQVVKCKLGSHIDAIRQGLVAVLQPLVSKMVDKGVLYTRDPMALKAWTVIQVSTPSTCVGGGKPWAVSKPSFTSLLLPLPYRCLFVFHGVVFSNRQTLHLRGDSFQQNPLDIRVAPMHVQKVARHLASRTTHLRRRRDRSMFSWH